MRPTHHAKHPLSPGDSPQTGQPHVEILNATYYPHNGSLSAHNVTIAIYARQDDEPA